MNISDEAVEAAFMSLPWQSADYVDTNALRAALEAAAPHLMAQVLEDLALQAEDFGDDGITSLWIRTRSAGAMESSSEV
jgi:hypothetical protein